MRHSFLLRVLIHLASLAIAGEVSAQLPAPPFPGFPAYVTVLENAFNARDLDAYGELFREDVKVFRDGKMVAADRPAFFKIIQAEFDRNLHLSHLSWAQGGQILVMEEVRGCIPPDPSPHTVYHGCYEARAVRYDLADDHKIQAVHFLEADRAWNMHVGDQ